MVSERQLKSQAEMASNSEKSIICKSQCCKKIFDFLTNEFSWFLGEDVRICEPYLEDFEEKIRISKCTGM